MYMYMYVIQEFISFVTLALFEPKLWERSTVSYVKVYRYVNGANVLQWRNKARKRGIPDEETKPKEDLLDANQKWDEETKREG